MSPDEAGKHVEGALAVTREDIARAKSWILQTPGSNTIGMSDEWLRKQGLIEIRHVDTESQDCSETLTKLAAVYSVRLAFFQAVWELIGAGELIAAASPTHWEPRLEYKTSRGGGAIPLRSIGCAHPEKVGRPPFASNEPADPDIFLKGIDCTTLHSGIREAIEQSLLCFRRGLYMPATAMLAAAAEATWTESGGAVAKNLSDTKLEVVVSDQFSSISRIVLEVRKALEHKKAKPLLQKAGQTIGKVNDAEIWTTALRDRRNALHWGKAKSFIADHSDTATLLMAAPLHLGTLEAIRTAC